MKQSVLLAAIIYFFGVNSINATPHIIIGDLKLTQAYTPKASEDQLREYLPEGEALEHWNRLASVRVFKNEKDPEKYLKRVAALVKKSHPAARAEFFENKKSKERVLDFITFTPEKAQQQFAEWNMMRATFVKGTGLVVYQYALRLYKVDDDSIGIIVAERRKMMPPFVQASFEEKE